MKPENCHCEECHPNTILDQRMILCSICGNKRCPHATSHKNECTGSNDVGQKGSSWEHVKPIDWANRTKELLDAFEGKDNPHASGKVLGDIDDLLS